MIRMMRLLSTWRAIKGSSSAHAVHLIRRHAIDRAASDSDDAVNTAFFYICRMRDRGRLDWIKGGEDFFRLMIFLIDRVIRDEKKRSNAVKRGGAGDSGRLDDVSGEPNGQVKDDTGESVGHQKADMDVDQLVCGQPNFADIAVAELTLEAFLETLPEETLRTILRLRVDGYSNKEIADRLGVNRKTVERKLEKIKSFYEDWNRGRNGK